MKKIAIIMSVLFFAGCYEDKGNYDYTEIGIITISDVNETYTSQKYMTLEIHPKIILERADEKDLEYLWEVNGRSVSMEKNLSYEVTESFQQEPYICRLIVTNKENNSKFAKVFNLKVVTPFYKGLTILSKVENDEAMLSYCPYSEEGVSGEMIHNVFFNENDYKIEGKPLELELGDEWDDMEGDFFLNTSKGSYDIASGIMKVATHYGVDKMMAPEQDIDIKGISLSNYNYSNYGGFISNGKVYTISAYNPYYSLPSSDPCPISGKRGTFIENYYLSDYFIARTNTWGSRMGILAYDNNKGQFLSFSTDMGAADTEQMAKVTVKDTIGLKMFYMGLAETTAYKHTAIFHDGQYGGWGLMPFLTTSYAANTAWHLLPTNYFNKDSKVIIETNYSKLYYSSGSKIYMIYLTDTNKKFESIEFKIEGFDNGTIVMMRFKDWQEQVMYVGVNMTDNNKIYEVDMSTKKIINTIDGFEGIPIDVFYK